MVQKNISVAINHKSLSPKEAPLELEVLAKEGDTTVVDDVCVVLGLKCVTSKRAL